MLTTMIRRNRPTTRKPAAARVRQGAQNAARRIRRLATAAFVAVLLAMGQAQVMFAQGGGGGGDGGTGAFGDKMEQLGTNLTALGRPLALVAVVIALLTTIFEPALPDLAKENKGVIRKVLLACIVLGLVPDLLGFVFA